MSSETVRVLVPLSIRRRNGRPRILPPENALEAETRGQDPHILKALGRAWAWRRRLETGEAATASDIAKAEKVTDRFVSRTMRLAYLSPEVLERLVVSREPPAISVAELIDATYLPWARQIVRVFADRCQRQQDPKRQPPGRTAASKPRELPDRVGHRRSF